MTRLVLDSAMRSKLIDLDCEVEFCDEAGRTLGYFLPAELHGETLREWAQSEVSEEELERRRNEPGGRTLKEIWARLGAK